MKILIGLVTFFSIWLILGALGINIPYVVPKVIEWSTKFILPWIFLYLLFRLIKTLEVKHTER